MKINENGIVRDMTPDEEAQINAEFTADRINELKQKLQDTDYKAIKYAEGWISAEEYESVRLQRQAWREEINSLEANLIQ